MMMKQLLTCAVLGLSALSFNAALAHGTPQPKHGGVVQTANDLTFELVASAGGAVIHVEDHGKPLATAGMKGKLTVMTGTQRAQADLVATGNQLQAQGVQLAPGARAVAAIVTPATQAITVRFVLR